MPCTVCGHADRQAIDEAVVTGQSMRSIASRHGVSKDAIGRHRAHISPALARLVAEREEAGPASALQRLESLYGKASAVLDAAQSEGKAQLSLSAIRELRGLVETLAKITGELDERPTTNVVNLQSSGEWHQLRTVVLEELAPYPEVQQRVAGRLLALVAEQRGLAS
ncbi:hypothetical protein DQ244_01595 [Blastococcus sp. TBT05-19]|nr:hypothetical protein DQ244_01595 [Blastococcus sp. TBT05-19]